MDSNLWVVSTCNFGRFHSASPLYCRCYWSLSSMSQDYFVVNASRNLEAVSAVVDRRAG